MSDDADTQAALRDFARTIGGLESTVKSMVSTWQAQEASASQGRRDLHQKMDALRADVQKLDGEVKLAIKDISLMKPTVEAVETAKLQAEGAVTAVRWSSRAVYWLAMGLTLGVGWVLSHWLEIKVAVR